MRGRRSSLASSAVTPGTQRYDPMTVLSSEPSQSPLPVQGRSTNLASAFVGARIIACSSEAAGCEAENLLYESRDLVWRARRGAKAARVALRLSAAGAPRLGFGADFVRSVGWRCAPGHAPVQATVEASTEGDAYRVLATLRTPDASAGEFHLWDLPSALDLTRERHVRFTLEGDAQLSSLLCCSDNARTAVQALAQNATPPRSDNEEDEDAAAARRALDETADELARKIDRRLFQQRTQGIERRQILLEIHPGLQCGELIEQPFPQRRDLGLNAAIKARHGQLGRPAAAGRHQLTHRLGTGEIEPAVEHGPLAELARLGPPHSRLPQHLFEHPLHGDHPAMAVDLHHVLTGEAAGPAHQQQQHLIEKPALAIDHMAIHHPVRSPLLSARAVHHAAPRRFRSRSGETNHGDTALPWGHGGGHGRNRVGAGHSSRRW